MAIVSGGVRSKGQSKRRAVRASIREVCLVGIESAGACPAPARVWAAGRRVTWSGRAYRVEAAQGEADEPRRYVHLAALAEGC
jgi:hypothetical protein